MPSFLAGAFAVAGLAAAPGAMLIHAVLVDPVLTCRTGDWYCAHVSSGKR